MHYTVTVQSFKVFRLKYSTNSTRQPHSKYIPTMLTQIFQIQPHCKLCIGPRVLRFAVAVMWNTIFGTKISVQHVIIAQKVVFPFCTKTAIITDSGSQETKYTWFNILKIFPVINLPPLYGNAYATSKWNSIFYFKNIQQFNSWLKPSPPRVAAATNNSKSSL